MNDLGTIAVACLTSIPCAILGCFLVLRRMSLLGGPDHLGDPGANRRLAPVPHRATTYRPPTPGTFTGRGRFSYGDSGK